MFMYVHLIFHKYFQTFSFNNCDLSNFTRWNIIEKHREKQIRYLLITSGTCHNSQKFSFLFLNLKTLNFSVLLLSIIILCIQIGLATYGVIRTFLIRFSTWGKLMTQYSKSLDKIDIARGRCVPAPPFDTFSETNHREHLSWRSTTR